MWLKITSNYSANFNTPKRQKKNIKYIIIHYTGMKNERLALNRLTDYKSKVSAHYFVKKNGKIINLVPDLYEAWHAGKSTYKGIDDCNNFSIGIELEGSDDDCYSNEQYKMLTMAVQKIIDHYPLIDKHSIAGHSDVSPLRKTDPGKKFDWERFLNAL